MGDVVCFAFWKHFLKLALLIKQLIQTFSTFPLNDMAASLMLET